MIPICTIKNKYDPELYVLILIMIQKKKGYYLRNTDKKKYENRNEKNTKLMSNIMVPIIKYIYTKSVCYFCDFWCYPVCDNCLYKFHKKKCGCNRSEFFYNIAGSELIFCDKINKKDRIFYFW